jgi:hypothetical protein
VYHVVRLCRFSHRCRPVGSAELCGRASAAPTDVWATSPRSIQSLRKDVLVLECFRNDVLDVGRRAGSGVPRPRIEILRSPFAELDGTLDDLGTPRAGTERIDSGEHVFGNVLPLKFLNALLQRRGTGRRRT